MSNIAETDNELYDIIKNGINKDMSDDEVMRVIKYVMKTLPTYNRIKGTTNAIEMVMKMFSLSCKIINLWHSTSNNPADIKSTVFVEEQSLPSFTNYYLTSRFNVEVYYSNLSFTEFTKNVDLFVRLIDSVKPITRILNQISYIVDELREYNFYDCKQIITDELQEETIAFSDFSLGKETPFRIMPASFCFVPSIDSDNNSVYGLLMNLANAPYKNFELTGGNSLTSNNIYICIDGTSKTLAQAISGVKPEYTYYTDNLSNLLNREKSLTINENNKLDVEVMDSGIKLMGGDTSTSTALTEINNLCTVIPMLTKIFKDSYNTENVIVSSTNIARPSYLELKVNHIKNTYSFGEV